MTCIGRHLLSVIFIFAISMSAASSNIHASERIALVIGNDTYAQLEDLRKAANDARAVKSALEAIGFRVISGINLTRRQTNRKLAELMGAIEPGDQVFVFFSGHGVAFGGENYLLPSDTPKPRSGQAGLVRDEAHALSDLIARVRARGASSSFFVVDACRNNPFEAVGVKSIGYSKGLTRVAAPSGVFVLFSAGIGQRALDRLSNRDPDPNSVFTRKLVPLLKMPGLSHVRLAKLVQEQVSSLAARIQHRQEPAYYDQIIGEVALIPGESCAGALDAWDLVGGAQSPGPLERFIARFPGCPQAELAQARLAALGEDGAKPDVAVGIFPDQEKRERCDDVHVSVASGRTKCIKPGSGESFKDCPECPEMVVAPAGSFLMGSPESEEGRLDTEGPQHEVTIPQPFAVGRFEVTWDAWEACVAAGGCDGKGVEGAGGDTGWGKGNRPVINVSWNDAQAYAKWLSAKTGKSYRLLSEAEWEYAARAGTRRSFSFEGPISPDKANYNGNLTYAGSLKGEYRKRTVPVDSFAPNPWGLYNVHGNVWEWVEDCWNGNYADKPDQLKANGEAWTTGECNRRIIRSGSWNFKPSSLRSASRYHTNRDTRHLSFGFRLARTLTPAAKSASACRELADTLSARFKVREGDEFCDAARQHTARVERIGDQSIRFVVDGGKKFTCREGELCGFDWSPGPTFRVTARADRARGIEPQGALLPR